jgi:hypothetical protein
MNFLSFKWDLEFIHEMVRTGAPVAVLGSLAAIAFGYLLEKPSMILVGGIILLVVSVDYILYHLFGSRRSGDQRSDQR